MTGISQHSTQFSIGLYETSSTYSSSPSKLLYKEMILIDGNTKATLASGTSALSLNSAMGLQNLYGYVVGIHFRTTGGTPTGGGTIKVDLTFVHEI